MSWLGGIGAGLSSLGQSMQKREEEKRSREERLNAIRDKLSLVNAQSPEKRRVIPGQELPDGVAGPPAPEMVETFKTNLEYDPEKGYVAKDEVTGSMRNQWSTTDKSAKEVGGKVYKKTTESDLAGNKRTSFDEEDAAKKLKRERLLRGNELVDVAVDDQMNVVKELGSGQRYKPAAAGRSPEEIQAAIDYRDKLARGRIDLAEKSRQDRYVGNFTAGEIDAWRGLKGAKREEYNASFGLPPNATEQQVRNAIRQRAIEDRSAPPDQARKDTEALLSNLPQDRQAKAAAEPEIGVNPDAAELMRRAQKAKGNDAEKSELWKNRDREADPFKRGEGDPEPKSNPMAVNDPKPKAAEEKPADKPKEESKKEDKSGVKFDDPVMQKNFEEDEAEFQRILRMTQGKEARDKLIADYQRQMMDLYDVRFK